MTDIQTTPPTAPVTTVSAQPAFWSTKKPASFIFAIGILLFLLPFLDIKCNDMSLRKVSGIQLATGFELKGHNDNPFFNDTKTRTVDEAVTRPATNSRKGPNVFALAALILGVVGLIISVMDIKSGRVGGIGTGALAAASLIGLFIDVRRQVSKDVFSGSDLGTGMSTDLKVTVEFTPWFYLAIIAFIAAAYSCYKRMQTDKLNNRYLQ